jgi:hypothetical protein
MMRAIVQHAYGASDVLRLQDIDEPTPGPHEVLVRVYAASINHGDWSVTCGRPYVIYVHGGGDVHPPHRWLLAPREGAGESTRAGTTRHPPALIRGGEPLPESAIARRKVQHPCAGQMSNGGSPGGLPCHQTCCLVANERLPLL